jgi:hypothetical protein
LVNWLCSASRGESLTRFPYAKGPPFFLKCVSQINFTYAIRELNKTLDEKIYEHFQFHIGGKSNI